MKFIWLGVMALMTAFLLEADQADPTVADDDIVAMVKTNYLFKFATANDWPQDAKSGPFKIAVYGSESILEVLSSKYVTKPVGSQPLEAVALNSPDFDDFYHIIYVDESKTADLPKIKKSVGQGPTLIVAHDRSSVTKGASIAFVTINNATKYIINSESAQARGITIGSTIILWAVSE